jgi:hypothetical protein
MKKQEYRQMTLKYKMNMTLLIIYFKEQIILNTNIYYI